MSTVSSLTHEAARGPMRSPLAVLTEQAARIAADTGGLLHGEVVERPCDEGMVLLACQLVAPAIDSRQRALVVLHGKEEPYPAVVDGEVFRSDGAAPWGEWEREGLHSSTIPNTENRAASDDELEGLIKRVFDSQYITSAIESLTARAAGHRVAG